LPLDVEGLVELLGQVVKIYTTGLSNKWSLS